MTETKIYVKHLGTDQYPSRGRVILMGVSSTEILTVSPEILFKRARIIGSTQNDREHLYEALDYVAKVKVKVMTEIFPLEEISNAYDKVAKGNVRFKAVIDPIKQICSLIILVVHRSTAKNIYLWVKHSYNQKYVGDQQFCNTVCILVIIEMKVFQRENFHYLISYYFSHFLLTND